MGEDPNGSSGEEAETVTPAPLAFCPSVVTSDPPEIAAVTLPATSLKAIETPSATATPTCPKPAAMEKAAAKASMVEMSSALTVT